MDSTLTSNKPITVKSTSLLNPWVQTSIVLGLTATGYVLACKLKRIECTTQATLKLLETVSGDITSVATQVHYRSCKGTNTPLG